MLPLDQVPNLSINMEELPTLQGWETGNVGQMPTPTKPMKSQAFKLAEEIVELPDKPAREPKAQPEQDPILMAGTDPQSTPTKEEDKIAAVASQILTENPDIAQHMMEKLKAHPGKSLRLEEFQKITRPIETPLQAKVVQEATTLLEPASGQVQGNSVRREVRKSFVTFEEFLA